MGKATGFLEIERQDTSYAPVEERLRHFDEFILPLDERDMAAQGARCMDCGIPFCHQGCPVDNIIPDWNDLVYRGDWRHALDILHSTNNFPEFTGRICPAPCEAACTLNITDNPVVIKTIERAIIDRGWQEGWVKPQPAPHKTGKRVGIIGSGPAGLACAQQLARVGHTVTVYEKADRIGGLLRYGIPNFKMEKQAIDRRVEQIIAEGVAFKTGHDIGSDMPIADILATYDAVVLAAGAEQPRDLEIPGRDLTGIHFAMDFLTQQNKRCEGDDEATASGNAPILAEGKHVVVIGGGDTGSDCIGTANRQKAASVTQLEILDQPPEKENKSLTWPHWPLKMRTSSSQEEGAEREWNVATTRFIGDHGQVSALQLHRVHWQKDSQDRMTMQKIAGSAFEIPADLVLLAMGFTGPVGEGLIETPGLERDSRGNVAANDQDYRSSLDKVFVAGDMRRGQSLVVWAIREGRQAARSVDIYLMGESTLPR